MPRFLPLFVVVASLTSAHAFQVTKKEAVSATGTIQAIDRTNRLVTLKDDATGVEDAILVGPQMKRFDELKVGDKVKVSYYESLVLELRKPGEKSTAAGDSTKVTKSPGAPGGMLSRQVNTTVTVNGGRYKDAFDHLHHGRWTHHHAEGRERQEPRRREAGRSHRRDVHAGCGPRDRADQVAGPSRPSEREELEAAGASSASRLSGRRGPRSGIRGDRSTCRSARGTSQRVGTCGSSSGRRDATRP